MLYLLHHFLLLVIRVQIFVQTHGRILIRVDVFTVVCHTYLNGLLDDLDSWRRGGRGERLLVEHIH